MALHEQAVLSARARGSSIRARYDGTATTAWQLKESRARLREQRAQAAAVRAAKERAAAVAAAAAATGREVRLDEPGGKAWHARKEKARASRWASAEADLDAHVRRVDELLAEQEEEAGGQEEEDEESSGSEGETAQLLLKYAATGWVEDAEAEQE